MKKCFFLLLLSLAKLTFSQSDYNPSPQTWIIDAETAPCGDIHGNECLLYKPAGKKEFEVLNEKIEGFDYEKGYLYTISVKQEIKQPPIALNESVFKYVLVKIISKKNVQPTSSGTFNSQQPAGEKILEISFETVPCETDNTKACLLVKEQGKKEFEILNAIIYGFNYETGNSYQIIVKPTTNGNYYFVREISKKNIKKGTEIKTQLDAAQSTASDITVSKTGKVIGKTNIQSSSELDKKWFLRKMRESDQSSFETDDNVMWIEINSFNNYLKGFGSCNTFESVIRTDLASTFKIDKLTSGYTNCGYKKLEDIFYNLLQEADGFEIRNGNLVLSKRWAYLLEFSSNPNYTEIKKSTVVNSDSSPLPQTTNKTQDVAATPSAELLEKELEALRKQLAEQKALKEKAEQEAALQKQKEAAQAAEQKALKEKAEQEAALQKQKEAAQAAKKAEMQKEIERMQKEMAEMDNSKSANTTTAVKKEPAASAINTKPTETAKIKSVEDNSYPNPKTENIVYYDRDKNLISTAVTSAIFKGSDKNTYLEMSNLESPLQFTQNNLPKFIVKTRDNENPESYISLYTCSYNFKTNKRQVYVKPQKNTVSLSFNELKPNVYEIILPQNLDIGEYAFVTGENTNGFKNVNFEVSSTSLACFGIAEDVNAGKQKKEKEKVKENENNNDDCKPDIVNIDKISKEKKEFWTLKLATSSVFADKANGTDQFIFYFQLIKIESKQYFSLVLQKTASMTSQLLRDDYVFEKGNKVLIGLADSKPYEMSITDVYKDKKVYESLHQVVTFHYLIHEIDNDEIPYIKDLLTSKNIDALRIVLNDGTMINKEVKEKKSDQLISKANCFFNAIEH